MAPAGALTAVQLSATVPAPAAAVTVVAGSTPTVADAVADPEPPLKYACARAAMTAASNMPTPQAAMSRLRRRPPAEYLVERFCARVVFSGPPGSPRRPP